MSYNSIQCFVHVHIKKKKRCAFTRSAWIHTDLSLVLCSSTCTQIKSMDPA